MAETTVHQKLKATNPNSKGRGRPRRYFNAKIISFSSRPRLMIGDVVELCRKALPGNHGKLAVITKFEDDGWVLLRSIDGPMDCRDIETGEISYGTSYVSMIQPENLYRRSNLLAPRS